MHLHCGRNKSALESGVIDSVRKRNCSNKLRNPVHQRAYGSTVSALFLHFGPEPHDGSRMQTHIRHMAFGSQCKAPLAWSDAYLVPGVFLGFTASTTHGPWVWAAVLRRTSQW